MAATCVATQCNIHTKPDDGWTDSIHVSVRMFWARVRYGVQETGFLHRVGEMMWLWCLGFITSGN